MAWLPRKLGWLLITYLALVGYALVAWLPKVVEQYNDLAEKNPRLSTLYLAAVAAGGLILVSLSLWLMIRLGRNTLGKHQRRAQRMQNPSQMSPAQKRAELSKNLASGHEFAGEEYVSSELRDEIERSLEELQSKQESSRLEIVAFGTISSGKSTLLNALAGRPVFAADVVGGTTTMQSEIPWPGNDKVILVDTPGLAEVRGESRAAEAALAARHSDLVLLVVDGPLKAYEVDLAQQLLRMEKRLVICLNKEDWYDEEDQQQLIDQIARQLPDILPADVVAVRAAGVSRSRIRVAADGREEQECVDLPPDVGALAARLMQIVEHDGRDLLLANLLMQSRGLVDEAKQRVRAVLDARADEIISRHMWAAGSAAGINPIPLLDIAGGSAITVKMVLELAHVYKQPIDADTVVKMLEQLGKNLIAMVGATAAAPAVASSIGTLLKTVPGIGTLAGGLVQGVVQALVTRWIGNVFVDYFQREMKAPPGGLAELAHQQWQQLTQPESLRKLIQLGRSKLASSPQEEES
ncbi:MAG: DUF697 domain-containing protein [Pirellulales bacterium]|nr:DUF697 domain-containing protein [Pirellulales bacterium]